MSELNLSENEVDGWYHENVVKECRRKISMSEEMYYFINGLLIGSSLTASIIAIILLI
jgi:hypothetical protein